MIFDLLQTSYLFMSLNCTKKKNIFYGSLFWAMLKTFERPSHMYLWECSQMISKFEFKPDLKMNLLYK